ncbi:MAG: hypothetical protein NTV50_14305 [Planctomycetota bacterium]|nr:hypothetical protein [Planctomycetota bacterium]
MKKILILIALMLFISPVSAQNKSNNKKGASGKGVSTSDTKKDDIQGAATWIVEVFDNGENKPGDVSRLKATKNFKIFRGENEIGTWRKIDETKVVVNIQNTDLKIGGTMELLLKEKTPPTFSGKIKKTDGSEYKVNVIMRKD